ncbi:MAG: hypothetical protein P1P83_00015 [Bacteroidales bacterium]|nr:hypothetical protein [Bacteroidales bacterium]MDT8372412.1 hypothetical protein [Bacteroidales bacterium]
MLFTFGALCSPAEKSCEKEEKVPARRHVIDKLNIFIVVNFPDITNNSGLKYKYPAAPQCGSQNYADL